MPLYQYHCDNCDRNFDIKKPIREVTREELCPDCNMELRREYTPVPHKWDISP